MDVDQTDLSLALAEEEAIMPGFRFQPTEEELVGYYLRRLLRGKHLPVELIPTVDLYQHDPWELPAMSQTGAQQWFFFVPGYSKFRNGHRPNRLTKSGYWKATGTDKPVYSVIDGSQYAALRKTLVFYTGKAPRGTKTPWVMNEYRMSPLQHSGNPHIGRTDSKDFDSTLCKIHQKPAQRRETRCLRAVSDCMASAMTVPYDDYSSDALCKVPHAEENTMVLSTEHTFDHKTNNSSRGCNRSQEHIIDVTGAASLASRPDQTPLSSCDPAVKPRASLLFTELDQFGVCSSDGRSLIANCN